MYFVWLRLWSVLFMCIYVFLCLFVWYISFWICVKLVRRTPRNELKHRWYHQSGERNDVKEANIRWAKLCCITGGRFDGFLSLPVLLLFLLALLFPLLFWSPIQWEWAIRFVSRRGWRAVMDTIIFQCVGNAKVIIAWMALNHRIFTFATCK